MLIMIEIIMAFEYLNLGFIQKSDLNIEKVLNQTDLRYSVLISLTSSTCPCPIISIHVMVLAFLSLRWLDIPRQMNMMK
jgi:hypothetical protein